MPRHKKYDVKVCRDEFGTYVESTTKMSIKESALIDILVDFADSIDPHGSSDGDYDMAMARLKRIIK